MKNIKRLWYTMPYYERTSYKVMGAIATGVFVAGLLHKITH
jgi:hypothetical protein